MEAENSEHLATDLGHRGEGREKVVEGGVAWAREKVVQGWGGGLHLAAVAPHDDDFDARGTACDRTKEEGIVGDTERCLQPYEGGRREDWREIGGRVACARLHARDGKSPAAKRAPSHHPTRPRRLKPPMTGLEAHHASGRQGGPQRRP